jgi:hypothetical protein
MVKARDNAPRAVASKRPRPLRRSIDGLDPDAVRAPGGKRFEARAMKRCFSGPAPIGFGGSTK